MIPVLGCGESHPKSAPSALGLPIIIRHNYYDKIIMPQARQEPGQEKHLPLIYVYLLFGCP